jgi:microcystin-dependent protein
MSEQYAGEIRAFAGNFAPRGWALCDGQLLPISDYAVLFNLIGTRYGGDGQSTFALPDLRGRLPLHQGGGYTLAQSGGAETVTLTSQQYPAQAHTHTVYASNDTADATSPQGNLPAATRDTPVYTQNQVFTPMAAQAIGTYGGNQPHNNFQPYLCVNFIISLFGTYPLQDRPRRR